MSCYDRYAAGTTPWGGSGSSFASFLPQRIDDGYLEVIGFTTASLVSWPISSHLVSCDWFRDRLQLTNQLISWLLQSACTLWLDASVKTSVDSLVTGWACVIAMQSAVVYIHISLISHTGQCVDGSLMTSRVSKCLSCNLWITQFHLYKQ